MHDPIPRAVLDAIKCWALRLDNESCVEYAMTTMEVYHHSPHFCEIDVNMVCTNWEGFTNLYISINTFQNSYAIKGLKRANT